MHEFLSPIEWPSEVTSVAGIDVVQKWLEQKTRILDCFDEATRGMLIQNVIATVGADIRDSLSSSLLCIAILEHEVSEIQFFPELDDASYELLLRGLYFITRLHKRSEVQILRETGNGFGYLRFKQSRFIDVIHLSFLIKKLQKAHIVPEGSIVDLGSGNGLTLLTMALCSHSGLVGLEEVPALINHANAHAKEFKNSSAVDCTHIRFVQTRFYSDKEKNDREVRELLTRAAVMYVYAYEDEFEERLRLFEQHAKQGAILIVYMHAVDLISAQKSWYAALLAGAEYKGLQVLTSSESEASIMVDQDLPKKDKWGNKATLLDMSIGRSCIIVQKV